MANWLTIPRIDFRYWLAILFASIFGTNLGDLYAHDSGLGTGAGLAVLTAIVVVLFVVARLIPARVEVFYWLVIAIIRTGATNIADFISHGLRYLGLYGIFLILAVAALLPLFAWLHQRGKPRIPGRLPAPDGWYWLAMLAAGVFGTMFGDIAQFAMGHGIGSIVLTALLAILLAIKGVSFTGVAAYWSILAVARTAGTAVGDWLAEGKALALGLPLATAISGVCFALILLFWPHGDDELTAVPA